ncbi:MAG TPA: hypothetical protein VNL16_04320 [Chloroflexota bacterium]|nr:hypothetical protein [Chloroflexota bacterium]
MIRRTLTIGVDDLSSARGALVCRDLPISTAAGPASIRRGTLVDAALCLTLAKQAGAQIAVVLPEPGELAQSEASHQFAHAVVGPGLTVDPPHQGQCVIHATTRGLVRVCPTSVVRINRRGAILFATALDGRVVAEGDTVAIVKAADLWTASDSLTRSLRAARTTPVLRVAPFAARKAAFLAGERIRPRNFTAAAENLRGLLAGFSVELALTQRVADDPSAIADAYRRCLDEGVEIILVGGSIALDPGDPFLVALERIEAELACRGAPIDPGTMFWVAHAGPAVVFGLASCELYGRQSILDLLLPYAVAKEPIDRALLAELGYGGLLDQTLRARQRSE